MNIFSRAIALLLLLLGTLFFSCEKNGDLKEDTIVPLASGYLRGVLENGLRYSIRANDRIKDRMVMKLGINAGSLQEEDDQRGLAHFVEHMAFNGSVHFPENSLIDFAQENGMKFGAHVNAYTSFGETVYDFVLPTDSEQLLDQGLDVLYDWLNGLNIKPEEVEKERGIVLSEWRTSLGFSARFRDIWIPILLEGSRFAQRLPIGLPDVIENAAPQRLRDFYEKWYNTENAILILVGDFDAEAMEQRLKQRFGSIARRGQKVSSGLERDWENVPIRDRNENGKPQLRAVQMQDYEAPYRGVSIAIKGQRKPVAVTVGQFREQWAFFVLGVTLVQRLSDIVKSHSDIVLDTHNYREAYGSASTYYFKVEAQSGRLREAYQILLRAIAQFQKYGILQSEMNLAIETLRSNVEENYNSREKRSNGNLASPELYQFLGTEYNSDIVWIYNNFDEIIGKLKLEDLNSMILEFLHSETGDVSLISVGKDLAELPSEEELIDGYLAMEQLEVPPPKDEKLPAQLLENEPKAGKIIAEKRLENTGFIHWVLNNGIEVYFKPTEFEINQFQYKAFRAGGTMVLANQFGTGSVVSSLLNNVVSASGFAGLSPEQYERYMLPKKVYHNWAFGLYSGFMYGGGDRGDIKESFQQIYLSFTAPQFSQKLIDQALKTLQTDYDDTLSDPNSHFSRLIREHRYQNDLRLVLPKDLPNNYAASDLQEAFEQLVPSAQGFQFVFVGDIAEEELKKYVELYLGGLPTQVPFGAKDVKMNLYEQGGVKEYFLGPENKSASLLLWDQYLEPKELSWEETYRLDILAVVLSLLLDISVTEVLREELSKTYSPYAVVNFESVPHRRMTILFYYGSAPEDVAELDKTVDQLLNQIKQGEIADNELEKVKLQLTKLVEDGLQQNLFWLDALLETLKEGHQNIDEIMSESLFYRELASIGKQDLAGFASKYILPARKIRYVMLPKNLKNIAE